MSAEPMVRPPFDFRRPDYMAEFARRTDLLRRIRANPSAVPALMSYYAAHPEQMIDDFFFTYDPRLPERGLPATIPFRLFDRQRELIQWFMDRWRNQQPGLVEKARDVGASWLTMAFSVAMCLTHRGITIGVGSRKEDLIDRTGDPSSLFHKARTILDHLPREFLGTWDGRKHSAHMRIQFPDTGSAIVGEAGDQIGRGGRTSIFFIDEAAFIEHPSLVEASLSATTNCRIDLSSVNGMANAFAAKRFGGKISVFTFGWRSDPRKDDAWYARKCEELDPVTVASEIDLSYNASAEGILIPSLWINAAIDAHKKLGIIPSGLRRAGLDVADEGRDRNALAGRHGILLEHVESWTGKGGDLFATVVRAFDVCEARGYEVLEFDSDGLGSGVRGDARIVNEKRVAEGRREIDTVPFRGSGSPFDPDREMVPTRLNRDFFANCKAQSFWSLRLKFQATYRAVVQGLEYDPDSIISIDSRISDLAQILMELNQPTFRLNNAGRVIVDKAPDGARSPNLADAINICFSPSSNNLAQWLRLAE